MSDRDSSSPSDRRAARFSRRGALLLGGGAVAGAALTAGGFGVGDLFANRGSSAPAAAATPPAQLSRYVSTMVTAPRISVWRKPGTSTAPGLFFATPRVSGFQGLITDNDGEPIWIEPDGRSVTDLRVQQYRGEPVLTYWSGTLDGGHGLGAGTILDTSYRVIAQVRAGHGLQSDLHEFELTPQGTALVTSYPTVTADLTSMKGPKNGRMYGCRIQEIDIASGAVLLDWHAAQHVDITESYQHVADSGTDANPYDPYHLNAASLDGDDAVLISSRHTHTIYSVDRNTGTTRWRLGGRKSDFAIASDATFAWQHHARRLSDGRISMFDNQYKTGTTGVSSGLYLNVNESAKTATLSKRLEYADHLSTAEGSNTLLDDGHVFIGWGDIPYATEFDSAGTAIWEASGLGDSSYRAFRQAWDATPQAAPAVVVDGGTAYVTWNGATGVLKWRFSSGESADALTVLATVDRAGFETSLALPSGAKAVGVEALDAAGAVIGHAARTLA
ncbi:arylsulfotransferase family protein [Gryllotalpicola reticulitermitis]|uniref:Arylsulfotransferase family protein n=1 Tax=Gryllotalpicola reticulitermitis TaxID=1184153 RepID=A0ABV8Q349_9MICO